MSKRIATNPADERSRLYIGECQSDSNPKNWYRVTIRRGQWECGCRGWTMHVPRRACKHITRLRASLSDNHDTNLKGIRLLDDWRAFRSYTSQPLGNVARVPELRRVEPGVLRPLAREFHVTMMVNRGYSSQSAMYESANRFKEKDGKYLTLLYLGDHDPSGEDMVRDIADLTFCKIMIRDAPSFHPRASISIRELRQDEINELPVDTRAELGRVTRMIMLAQRRSQP